MGKPSPWLTDNEIDYELAHSVPRPTLVFDAILEIIEAHLPRQAERYGLPLPGGYGYYGNDMRQAKGPYILLASSESSEEYGVGFHDVHNIIVACVFAPQVNSVPVRQCTDLLSLVGGILAVPRINGNYHGPAGSGSLLLWVQFLPTVHQFMPADWPEYRGTMSHWLVRQPPSPQAWVPEA